VLIMKAAFAGPVVLTILSLAYSAAFEPDGFNDGQSVFVFFFTVPIGAALGVAVGSCWTLWRQGERRQAAICAIAGGIAVFLLSLGIAMASSSTRGGRIDDLVATMASGAIAPAWISALIIHVWGLRMLKLSLLTERKHHQR
jgi:hypothetical protein